MQAQTFPCFLPNKGITLNKPEEFLAEQFSPYSRNMQFYNEKCQGRGGLGKWSNTALSGPILTMPDYRDAAGTIYKLFATTKDIYKYDFGNARFDILTPLYTTGTIEIKTGELNKVYGSGTPAWSTNLKAGDFIKIGSGSVHTGSTWYEIASVDSDTLLTLTSNATITAAGTAYVARKTFTGTVTSQWDWVQFTDDVLGETLLMTNGVGGEFVRWSGTGQFTAVTGLSTALTACRYLSVFAGRVLMSWTVEGGYNQPQRIRWSETANCLSWLDEDFQDFFDEPTEMSGMCTFNGYHVIWKEKQAYVGRYVGGTYLFEWTLSPQAYGLRAPLSTVIRNDFIYYYGHDKKFHRFNLLLDDVLSESVFVETKEFDPNYDKYIQGFNVTRLNEVRWFCPYGSTTQNNYCFVWNYQQNIPQVWEYEHPDACLSIGTYVRTSDVYADDPIYGAQYADETGGYADDSTFLSGAENIIYGGYDGYVRNADSGVIDDGYSYTRLLRLKRMNFNLADKLKRLWKTILWLDAEISGSVEVKMRSDDKTSYDPGSKTVSLISDNSDKDIIKSPLTWDRHAQNFQLEMSSQDHFSVLGVIFLYFQKKRSWKT